MCRLKLTEKQKNCKYCHHEKNIVNIPGLCVSIDPKVSNGNLTIKYDASNKDMTDNNIVIGDDDGYVFGGWNLTINYCPMCGRSLSDEND